MAAKKKTARVVAVVAGAAVIGGILYLVFKKPAATTTTTTAVSAIDPCKEALLLATIQNPTPAQAAAAASWKAKCNASGGTV
jgi:hypothetical protein